MSGLLLKSGLMLSNKFFWHAAPLAGDEVREGGDGLNLDGVPILVGVVKDSRRVHNLPPQVLVVDVVHNKFLTSTHIHILLTCMYELHP